MILGFLIDLTVFLAAFLLFQIELILSKLLLFKFGGTYTVWGAALVFFQATLLAGYLFSHYAVRSFGMRKYRYIHLFLLGLTLFFLPGLPVPSTAAFGSLPLVVTVFILLIRIIGLAFFVLATTSVIFQAWLGESEIAQKANPYRLYAVSNLGSFAGLLSYPFVFEAFIDMKTQLLVWKTAYFVLFLANLLVFILVKMSSPGEENRASPAAAVRMKDKLQWFLLSASGVIMFLSVTNIITAEIAPIPVLWVIPLGLYLLSFVLTFKQKPWCPFWVYDKFYITAALCVFLFLVTIQNIIPMAIVIILHLALLFLVCMFCQFHLHKRRPEDIRNLTGFYVMVSFGGFAGGMLVSWVIPLVSSQLIEYFTGLCVIVLVSAIDEKKFSIDAYGMRLILYFLTVVASWPILFPRYNVFGIVLLATVLIFIFAQLSRRPAAFALGLSAAILFLPLIDTFWSASYYMFRHRNYYSIYKIYQRNGMRILVSNTTFHGAQYLAKEKAMEPLMYYHNSTPVGKVMASELFNFNRIGVVGLGTGTLAVYGKKGQEMDFLELDPDVLSIARGYFTYLDKTPAEVNCIIGDARMSLEKIPDKTYDLLVVDAFSGDAIPVHLITVEALKEYFRCIKENGLILFHITNRYVDLAPILFVNARILDSRACINFNPAQGDCYSTVWFAMTKSEANFKKLTTRLKWRQSNPSGWLNRFRPWTDDYSHVLGVLKTRDLLQQIKEFKPFYWD